MVLPRSVPRAGTIVVLSGPSRPFVQTLLSDAFDELAGAVVDAAGGTNDAVGSFAGGVAQPCASASESNPGRTRATPTIRRSYSFIEASSAFRSIRLLMPLSAFVA